MPESVDAGTSDSFYHNQDYTKEGLLLRTVFRDRQGALYSREEHIYDAEGNRTGLT